MFVHNALVDYAVRLVLATREPAAHGVPDVAPLIQYGASPRASLGIVRAARALALMRGPGLRAAAGPRRHRAGHPAPPAGAQLRRAGRRHPGRPDRGPDHSAVPLPTRGAAAERDRAADRLRAPANRPDSVDARCLAGRGTEVLSPRADPDRPQSGASSQHGLPLHAERADATLNRLQLVITRSSTGCCRATTSACCPGRAARRGSRASTGRATTYAGWTGRSPPGPRSPHVRQTIADRELETWLAVDLSASLDFGTRGLAQAGPGDRRGGRGGPPDRARRQPDRRRRR